GFAVELEMWDLADGKGIDDLLAAGKTPDVITDGGAIKSAVEHLLSKAAKADPPPEGAGLAEGQVNEAYDDPHRLARQYRGRFLVDQEHSLYYHREEYVRWDGRRYQTVLPKETKAELTCA